MYENYSMAVNITDLSDYILIFILKKVGFQSFTPSVCKRFSQILAKYRPLKIKVISNLIHGEWDRQVKILNQNKIWLGYLTLEENTKNLLLCVASGNGCLNLVKYLIEKGADPNYQNNFPFKRAVSSGHFHIMKYFVEELKVDPNINNNFAFRVSSLYGYIDIIIYLSNKVGPKISLLSRPDLNKYVLGY